LYNGSLAALEWEHFAPIKRSRELLELLTWCHRNGVIDSSTRLALHPGSSDLSEFELFNLLGSLQQSIACPARPSPKNRCCAPACRARC
jgi:adenylate cyclase class 1